jgi:hypothetical protein
MVEMRRSFLILFTLSLISCTLPGGCLFGQSESSSTPEPKIVIPEKEYDFGQVYRGTMIEHVFAIRNEGTGNLIIQDIKRDCGCTNVEINTKVIPMNGKAELKVILDTKEQKGEIWKRVRLITNDPVEKEAPVSVIGKVLITAKIEPDRMVLGEFLRGDLIPEKTIKITPEIGFEDLEIVDVVVRNKNLQAEVLELGKDEDYIEVVVNFDTETPRNFIMDQIKLITNRLEEPILQIPVKVNIRQPYEVNPKKVVFSGIKSNNESVVNQKVIIINNEPRPLQVLNIESNNEYVKTELVKVEEGKKYVLKVGLKPGFPEKGLTDIITILTDHPEYPQRLVAVYVRTKYNPE